MTTRAQIQLPPKADTKIAAAIRKLARELGAEISEDPSAPADSYSVTVHVLPDTDGVAPTNARKRTTSARRARR